MLFSACLEMVVRELDWTEGIKFGFKKLKYLRFADDIILIGSSMEELQKC